MFILFPFLNRFQQTLYQINFFFFNITIAEEFDRRYEIFYNILLIKNCNLHFKKRSNTHKLKLSWWLNELKKQKNLLKAKYIKSKFLSTTEQDVQNYKCSRAQYKKAV